MNKYLVVVVAAVLGVAVATGGYAIMGRKGNHPALAPLTPSEVEMRDRLQAHVKMLAGTIGGRDALHYEALEKAADYIEAELRSDSYHPERQSFSVDGKEFRNIEAEHRTAEDSKTVVIIGAHYDTAGGLPGANDNASGVAACLELARKFAQQRFRYTLRWVFFANEEPPFFQTAGMAVTYTPGAVTKEMSMCSLCSLLKPSATTRMSPAARAIQSVSIQATRIVGISWALWRT